MINAATALLAFWLAGAAHGAMYKCVDASGRTAYSDAPCEASSRTQKRLPDQGTGTGAGAAGQASPLERTDAEELSAGQRSDYSSRLYRVCMDSRAHSEVMCRCLSSELAARARLRDYKYMMTMRAGPEDSANLMRLLVAGRQACLTGRDALARAAAGGDSSASADRAKSGPDPARQFDTADAGAKPSGTLAGTGTGFLVSSVGHVMTNLHVTGQCKQVRAKHATGEVVDLKSVAVDTKADLALLKGNFLSPLAGAAFRSQDAPLGEAVVVFGFPLSGTLAATGNLTTGTLSGLAGFQNDPTRYQISAPVQPGNSGGAVLDEGGLVIGIVQSKLNAARVQMASGDIPQNVNFAVKGKVVQAFLGANAVKPDVRGPQGGRKVSEIAQDATRFSVLIGCFR